jgi:arginyl-tRNA synthetase
MGYSWAKDCKHVYHGLYLDKSGKKFSTRKGKTVFMKEILDETKEFARVEIKKRLPKLSKKELEKRSLAVAIAAIFYGDLKNTRTNDIIFDIERFVSFEGDTGPYLLYSYARASSIIKKSKIKKVTNTLTSLETKETELVIKLSKFNEAILSAKENLNPAIIANYAYQLSQLFNEFYHECPVIGSKQEQFRISLVEAFRQVIKNALALLGINTIEEM